MDVEAERERVRLEEEAKKREEEARRIEEERNKKDEEDQLQARINEALALAREGQRKVEEERIRKEIEAAKAKLTVPALMQEEMDRRAAERQRKGKALAIDIDSGANVGGPTVQFLADETGDESTKTEVKRLVDIIRKAITTGYILQALGEATIF